ncbi:MAG: hypothetical protein D6808_02510 [Candidatus Dadabacteria bacterium]|nr:MAG: hypothetical protein D6808_02510 [Candidatus Dadabacteria bacterium]
MKTKVFLVLLDLAVGFPILFSESLGEAVSRLLTKEASRFGILVSFVSPKLNILSFKSKKISFFATKKVPLGLRLKMCGWRLN